MIRTIVTTLFVVAVLVLGACDGDGPSADHSSEYSASFVSAAIDACIGNGEESRAFCECAIGTMTKALSRAEYEAIPTVGSFDEILDEELRGKFRDATEKAEDDCR